MVARTAQTRNDLSFSFIAIERKILIRLLCFIFEAILNFNQVFGAAATCKRSNSCCRLFRFVLRRFVEQAFMSLLKFLQFLERCAQASLGGGIANLT